MSDASPKPPPRGVSLTTLILTAALTATTTAAVVLAVLYFTSGRLANPGAPGQPSLLTALTGSGPTPNVQKDAVKPQGHPTGEVFYPIPYAAPPHLTLTAPHRSYSIVMQDEYGFSWSFDYQLGDFVGDYQDLKDVLAKLGLGIAQLKPDVQYEDFTWEAKGVPAGADVQFQRPLEQTGTFQSVLGAQGQESFAIPYTSPPQVTLTGHSATTVLVEATNAGFKWKNDGMADPFANNYGPVTWTAKGIRATKLPK